MVLSEFRQDFCNKNLMLVVTVSFSLNLQRRWWSATSCSFPFSLAFFFHSLHSILAKEGGDERGRRRRSESRSSPILESENVYKMSESKVCWFIVWIRVDSIVVNWNSKARRESITNGSSISNCFAEASFTGVPVVIIDGRMSRLAKHVVRESVVVVPIVRWCCVFARSHYVDVGSRKWLSSF